jgi:tRNA (guanine26-N2/guanine27-N2)-dimethyltransferase
MSDDATGMATPQGWPGQLWLEGRTIIHLKQEQERPTHMPRGPAKNTGQGFLNPAMAPARTRSVLLLADALENDWLVTGEKPIRVLDALCATGVRVRRWRNEIPANLQQRLRISANDLDEFALNWTRISHITHPPEVIVEQEFEDDRHNRIPSGEIINGIHIQQLDARVAMMESAFQWVDLDPFGSPVSFLDSALQCLSRSGVLEVTATDTAALTGSSPSSMARRYGAKGLVDIYAHDDAVRILLGLIATSAARLDKKIKPILALFDGHHVRVSVQLKTSKEGASEITQNMGWRVRGEDVPYRFVTHPNADQLENASGPMWIGPLWDAEIAGRMSEEKAIQMCSPSAAQLQQMRASGLVWNDEDIEYSQRELRRSVRYIADAADLMSRDHLLINLDSLPKWAGTGGAPKMEKIIAALQQLNFAAARLPDLEPVFVTDAAFADVIKIVQQLWTPNA